jgi:hypothetical protein
MVIVYSGYLLSVKYGAFVLPVIIWMFFGFILIPIAFAVLLLRGVAYIPRILKTKVEGVSIAWWLLPIVIFILLYLLYHYILQYW